MRTIVKSLKHIHWNLFLALLVMGLCPTIYTTVRIFFLGQLPGDWAYSIAGQLSWVNLLYEIINEAIILPLFFFIGKVVNNKDEFTNRLKTGLLASLGIYRSGGNPYDFRRTASESDGNIPGDFERIRNIHQN